MKKQQGFVNIMVMLVVLVIIAGTGYFVLVDRPNTPSSQKQPEIKTNVISPEPSVNVENVTPKKNLKKQQRHRQRLILK